MTRSARVEEKEIPALWPLRAAATAASPSSVTNTITRGNGRRPSSSSAMETMECERTPVNVNPQLRKICGGLQIKDSADESQRVIAQCGGEFMHPCRNLIFTCDRKVVLSLRGSQDRQAAVEKRRFELVVCCPSRRQCNYYLLAATRARNNYPPRS